ncbi:MAG: BamA/TamA family outer membrane protein [Syntrophaceae bacterium]|nr:BamA/TamA family outer membrane protein [Syntrophaceae bacterium]
MTVIRPTRAAALMATVTLFVLSALSCPALSSGAEDPPALYKIPGRPKVGLVLSGGGARGVAHIGVLKVLEELRVPVDFIAGTSMGSLVGGLYASGMSPGEMEKRIEAMDWEDIFRDTPTREYIPWRQKRDDFKGLLGLELGFRDGKILLPMGTTSGYKLEFLLTAFVGLEQGRASRSFDAVPIPFRAVAMDLEDGRMRVFDRGALVMAMRASMSIPAVFAPVEIDGRLYVDGGMVRNLPVDVAREAGCEVIIAVNLGTTPRRREQLTSAASVALQAINLMTDQNVRVSLGELTEKDILITPQLGEFSSSDFAAAMKTIPIGVDAARAAGDRLKALSVSEEDFRAWQSSLAARKIREVERADIRVADTMKRVNPAVIEAEIRQEPARIEAVMEGRLGPERSWLESFHKNLTTVFGRGDFERLDYRLLDDRERNTIQVEGVEKSWGPNYFKFGIGYATDFQSDPRLNAAFMYRMTWLNSLGAEWRTDARVGYVDEIHTEFYQPFTPRVGVFAAPWLDLRIAPIAYYFGSQWVGEYDVGTFRGGLDLGVQGRLGELRAGFFQGRLKTDGNFGVLSLAPSSSLVPEYNLRQGGFMGRLALDRLDNVHFPATGFSLMGSFFVTNEAFGAEDNYNKYELTFQKPFHIGRHTLTLGLSWGDSPGGTLPLYDLFQTGGFLRFSGYATDQLVGRGYHLGRLVYTYRFSDLPAPVGRGLYLGGSLEAGEVKNRFDPTTAGGTLYCGSLFFAADTILGPFHVAYGRSDDGSGSFYVLFGVGMR